VVAGAIYNDHAATTADRCNTLPPRPLPTNNTGTSSPLRSLPIRKNMLPQTTDNNAYISIPPVCTHAPNFVNEISSPLTLMIILHLLYNSSDLYVQPEDGLTGRG